MKVKSLGKVLCVLGICMSACSAPAPETPVEEPIQITNKIEIESTPADMDGYVWIDEERADFQLIPLRESIRFFKEGGSGILYYGKVNCDWCQRAVPQLNLAARELGVTVYYVDVSDATVTYEEYEELVKCIDSTFRIDDTGEKAFFVPEVIAVKDGEVVGYHISLVDGYDITKSEQMSDSQKDELAGIYREVIKNAKDQDQ